MEHSLDKFKNFFDFLQLKLIFFDDSDDFQNLRMEYLLSWHFQSPDSRSNVFELFFKLLNEHFERLFFLIGDGTCFFPFFSFFFEEC
jgi:hypothetical protein